jgi:hypothetical protein
VRQAAVRIAANAAQMNALSPERAKQIASLPIRTG